MKTDHRMSFSHLIPLTSCEVCGGREFKILRKEGFIQNCLDFTQIVRCKNCGLRFMNPMPHYTYEEEFFEKCKGEITRESERELAEMTPAVYRDRLERLRRLLPEGKKFLEIGSGCGDFLAVAKEMEWDELGVEISRISCAKAQERGLNVICGTIEQVNLPLASFDLIHSHHVLEHVEKPMILLAQCFQLLKPGGILALEVPHEFSDLIGTWLEYAGRKRVQYPQPQPHIFFFTPPVLKRMAEQIGFRVISLKTPRYNAKSRFFGGTLIIKGLAWVESKLLGGPSIEIFARKP